jgi:hypothetical protein
MRANDPSRFHERVVRAAFIWVFESTLLALAGYDAMDPGHVIADLRRLPISRAIRC